MNIYFSASTNKIDSNKDSLNEIIKNIEDLKHKVLNSWFVRNISPESKKLTSRELLAENKKMILDSDALILEVSTPSIGVGYLLGYALAHRKTVLCLYREEFNDADLSEVIKGESSSLIIPKKYSSKNIGIILKDFLENLEFNNLQKFNFVASKEVIDFIKEGSKKEKKSNSEFLRDLITSNYIR